MNMILDVFRKFFAIFIPQRSWRTIVREGYFCQAVRTELRYHFGKETTKFKHNLSVMLIVKDAAQYMDEWINYHKIVGVDHFYIYDNESGDNLREVLDPYIKSGLVSYTYWPGKRQQIPAYNNAMVRYRDETRWLAFIDDDEFIVPMEKATVPEVLDELKVKAGLAMPWMMYGVSGQKEQAKGLVMERCYMTEDYKFELPHAHKVIINPRLCLMLKAHVAFFVNGMKSKNEDGVDQTNMFEYSHVNKIRLNHYRFKSEEEFFKKSIRGDVLKDGYKIANRKYFDDGVKVCDVVRDDTMQKYLEPVKAEIKKIRG